MTDNPELRVRERGPGAVLAAARTAQNLSIADVARQLKLSANQVAALEAGEYEQLPGPVFVRGFVRNYARLLRIDPDRLLAMVSDIPGQDVPSPMPTTRGTPFSTQKKQTWPRAMMLAALLAVIGLGAYEFYWHERGAEEGPFSPAAPVAVQEASGPLAPAVVPSEPPAPALTPEPAAAEAMEATASTAQSVSDVEAASSKPEEGVLRLSFDRESWVQVRDGDGKVIMTRLNAAGSEQRLSGKPPFSLVIGNARGVQLSYNGEPVDLKPYTVRDDIARLRLQ